jgi:hypothetical protein
MANVGSCFPPSLPELDVLAFRVGWLAVLAGLSVWPGGQFGATPPSLPSRHGGAASPNGHHDGQRRGRVDGPGTAPAAARWPSAAISAAWRTGKPTYPASLLLICRAVPPIVGAGLVLPRKTVRRSRALLAHRRAGGLLSSLPAQAVLTGMGEPGRVNGLPARRSASCPGTADGRRMTSPARITATHRRGSPAVRPSALTLRLILASFGLLAAVSALRHPPSPFDISTGL